MSLLQDPATVAWGVLAFVLGGLVKGTMGVGLPLVVVPLLSLLLPSPTAIALVSVPVVMSNLVQTWQATPATRQAKRFTPLIVCMVLATVVTVPMTLALPVKTLNAMLAGAVLLAVVTMAYNPVLNIQPQQERK